MYYWLLKSTHVCSLLRLRDFNVIFKGWVLLHPSVEIGSFTGLGLGWPKPIHNAIPIPVAKPVNAP